MGYFDYLLKTANVKDFAEGFVRGLLPFGNYVEDELKKGFYKKNYDPKSKLVGFGAGSGATLGAVGLLAGSVIHPRGLKGVRKTLIGKAGIALSAAMPFLTAALYNDRINKLKDVVVIGEGRKPQKAYGWGGKEYKIPDKIKKVIMEQKSMMERGDIVSDRYEKNRDILRDWVRSLKK